jgi:hypothetical protein
MTERLYSLTVDEESLKIGGSILIVDSNAFRDFVQLIFAS